MCSQPILQCMLTTTLLLLSLFGSAMTVYLVLRFRRDVLALEKTVSRSLQELQELLHEIADHDSHSNETVQALPVNTAASNQHTQLVAQDIPSQSVKATIKSESLPSEAKVSYVYLPTNPRPDNARPASAKTNDFNHPSHNATTARGRRSIESIGGARASDRNYENTIGPKSFADYSPRELKRMTGFGRRMR